MGVIQNNVNQLLGIGTALAYGGKRLKDEKVQLAIDERNLAKAQEEEAMERLQKTKKAVPYKQILGQYQEELGVDEDEVLNKKLPTQTAYIDNPENELDIKQKASKQGFIKGDNTLIKFNEESTRTHLLNVEKIQNHIKDINERAEKIKELKKQQQKEVKEKIQYTSLGPFNKLDKGLQKKILEQYEKEGVRK